MKVHILGLTMLLATLLVMLPAQGVTSCEMPSYPAALLQVSSARKTSRSAQIVDRPITFVTVRDDFFAANLAMSNLWKNRHDFPHQWLVLTNEENKGISSLYAQAQTVAQHPLMVFLHPDVMLPEEFYDDLMLKLTEIESTDPNWGVLGTAGVPLWWHMGDSSDLKIASSISDFMTDYHSGADLLEVQSLDEHLLVLRSGSPSFDPKLPGFDLYGSDIVMSARSAGKKAYLLNIKVEHKRFNAEGHHFDPQLYYSRLADPAFHKRSGATYGFVQQKWCTSGLLPVYGTTFDLYACR